MALQNSLAPQPKDTQVTEYSSNGEKIRLSPTIIKKYLVSGDVHNVTDQEVMMFLSLCRANKLNPFIKECYLIKYGSQPASLVTGKDTFLKRANRNPNYAGKSAGVIVMNRQTGVVTEREGEFALPDEEVVGGWAKVFLKDRNQPEYAAVSFNEYAGRKKDGSLNSQWLTKPATMIRKVALVHALREAFPEEYQGMYSPEEIPQATEVVYSDVETEIPVQVVEENQQQAPQQAPPVQQDPGPVFDGQQQSVEQMFFGN